MAAAGVAGGPRRTPLAPARKAWITGSGSSVGVVTSTRGHPARCRSWISRPVAGPNSTLIRATSPVTPRAITSCTSATESAFRTRPIPVACRPTDSGTRVAGRGSATNRVVSRVDVGAVSGGDRCTGSARGGGGCAVRRGERARRCRHLVHRCTLPTPGGTNCRSCRCCGSRCPWRMLVRSIGTRGARRRRHPGRVDALMVRVRRVSGIGDVRP